MDEGWGWKRRMRDGEMVVQEHEIEISVFDWFMLR